MEKPVDVVDAPVVNQTVTNTSTEHTTQATAPVVPVVVTPEIDLMTKVSQFKSTQAKTDNITNAPEQPEFESIKDPVAKEAAKQAVERIRRGFQSDYTKKLEDANRLVEQTRTWTPHRIQQELLNNPEFLNAAQLIAGQNQPVNNQVTEEMYSALTDVEKAKFNMIPRLENEINQLKQSRINEAIQSEIVYKDSQLKAKYPEYDPNKINEAVERLGKMNLADIREFVYKAITHDDTVKSVYAMALAESKGLTQQKIDAFAPSGINASNNEGVPTKEKGEKDEAFFVRLGTFRLAQHRKR